jgi:hypothetical protein
MVKRDNAELFEKLEISNQKNNDLERRLLELENLKGKYALDDESRIIVRDSMQADSQNIDSNSGDELFSVVGIHSSIDGAKEHQRALKRESDLNTKLILDNSGEWYMLVAQGNEIKNNDPYIFENLGENEFVSKEGSIKKNKTEKSEKSKIHDTNGVADKFVTNNSNILDDGYYVVIAARWDKKLAISAYKRMSKTRDVMLVKSASNTWYHVVLNKVYSSKKAADKAAEVRNEGIKDAWWTTGKKLTK